MPHSLLHCPLLLPNVAHNRAVADVCAARVAKTPRQRPGDEGASVATLHARRITHASGNAPERAVRRPHCCHAAPPGPRVRGYSRVINPPGDVTSAYEITRRAEPPTSSPPSPRPDLFGTTTAFLETQIFSEVDTRYGIPNGGTPLRGSAVRTHASSRKTYRTVPYRTCDFTFAKRFAPHPGKVPRRKPSRFAENHARKGCVTIRDSWRF